MAEHLQTMEMGDERESFSIEVDSSTRKKRGYYVRKRTLVLVALAAVILLVFVGVISAYLGPGKSRERSEGTTHGKAGTSSLVQAILLLPE